MNTNLIVFYISSHGFGHMTRCLSIIEMLLEQTNYSLYITSGKLQNDFARAFLSVYANRLIFSDIETDIGLINIKNSLKIDTKVLENKLYKFVSSWESIVNIECRNLSKYKLKCLITDISPIGALVAERLKVKSYGISNFTWVEQYERLNINEEILNKFKGAYEKLESFIEYELALKMNHKNLNIYKIGFVSRKNEIEKVNEIKSKYGKSYLHYMW